MITGDDVKHVVSAWKLFWGRNLVDTADGVGVLLEDCQRLTDSGLKLRQFLQDFRRLHEHDTPSWNQFAAFLRQQKPTHAPSYSFRPPILTRRPDGESVRITPSRWREHDALLGLEAVETDEPTLDVGDPRVGEYLAAIRAALPSLVGRLRSLDSDRYTPRRERERTLVGDDPKALQARQALLMGGDECDVPEDVIPF